MSKENGFLQKDPWLAGILNREVYRIAAEKLPGGDWALPAETSRVFAYAKLDPQAHRAIGLLEDRGFRLVDTNVTFGKAVTPAGTPDAGQVLRAARPGDEEAVTAIARSSFVFSRFHADPLIPRETADEVKARWAANFFSGARGDAMIVAEHNGRVSGFLLLALKKEEQAMIIDLIAVDKTARDRGIASGMIRFAERSLRGFRTISVGTQLANQASIRLYESLGFRFASAAYVFHFHGGGESKTL